MMITRKTISQCPYGRADEYGPRRHRERRETSVLCVVLQEPVSKGIYNVIAGSRGSFHTGYYLRVLCASAVLLN